MPKQNNTNFMLDTEENISDSSNFSQTLRNAQQVIYQICESLNIPTNDYSPNDTIKNIESYLSLDNILQRVLYSEISNYIFSLDIQTRGTFITNTETLLYYAFERDNRITDNVNAIIARIYDHSQLALHQIENTNNIFADSVEQIKTSLRQELKGTEREYITILGIFAAIILAFVGGITFSTSVLQNIAQVSIYRLLIVVDMLALILVNLLAVLMRFICKINGITSDGIKINVFNFVCIIFGICVILHWQAMKQ